MTGCFLDLEDFGFATLRAEQLALGDNLKAIIRPEQVYFTLECLLSRRFLG